MCLHPVKGHEGPPMMAIWLSQHIPWLVLFHIEKPERYLRDPFLGFSSGRGAGLGVAGSNTGRIKEVGRGRAAVRAWQSQYEVLREYLIPIH